LEKAPVAWRPGAGKEAVMTKTYATKYMHVRRLDNGAVVLKPHGEMIGGAETDELEKIIDQLDSEGVPCLVVNLVDVGMMNSLAISRLVSAHVKFSRRKAHVGLCNVDKKIDNVFVITKLSLVFKVYPSEEAAIAACGGEA